MNGWVWRTGGLVCLWLLCEPMTRARADEPLSLAFVQLDAHILGINGTAWSRFVVADFDGDGKDDLAFCGKSGSSALLVVGLRDDATIGFKQMHVLEDESDIKRVLTADIGGTRHVYTIATDGTVRDFAGWPLTELGHFAVADGIVAAAVGDLYGTGANDLVVATEEGAFAYAIDTGAPLWHYPLPDIHDIALAQLDGDPALEVVLGSTPGVVIDGATQATDWQYADGFGFPLATGRLNGDSTTQFVGGSNSGFTVFRGEPWMASWTIVTGGTSAIATADLDHGVRDVVLSGDSQFGEVHVVDAGTHQERFAIPNPGLGIASLASMDIDADGVPEIVFAAYQYNGGASLEIVDSRTGNLIWSFVPQDGYFSAVLIGDVDGDARQEMVAAGNNGYDFGPVEVFDALSGDLEWQSPLSMGNANDPLSMATARVLLAPHANDSGHDIVLAGPSSYSGRIVFLDGATHAVRLQIGSYASGPMQQRNLRDAALLDYDGDGVVDVVAATQPFSSPGDGALLQVFSGTDGHTLWTSVPMGSVTFFINSVLVTGPREDPSATMVAVLSSGLRAYNIQTQLLDWTLAATNDGAIYIPHGVAGPEIAVFQQVGAVTFYDATTRAYLRSFSVPGPLNAIYALDDTSDQLLIASANELAVVDARTGAQLARSALLGESLGAGNRLAVLSEGNSSWLVGSGNAFGVFRHRLAMAPDRVFSDGFEGRP